MAKTIDYTLYVIVFYGLRQHMQACLALKHKRTFVNLNAA
jgi:hypothetical protein